MIGISIAKKSVCLHTTPIQICTLGDQAAGLGIHKQPSLSLEDPIAAMAAILGDFPGSVCPAYQGGNRVLLP